MADHDSTAASRRGPAWVEVAASLQGCLVHDRSGGVAGSIAGVVTRGSARYAVIASGGFLGLGERRFLVPWSALQGQGPWFVLRDTHELEPEHGQTAAAHEPTQDGAGLP